MEDLAELDREALAENRRFGAVEDELSSAGNDIRTSSMRPALKLCPDCRSLLFVSARLLAGKALLSSFVSEPEPLAGLAERDVIEDVCCSSLFV
jgi:hypothetical protein